MAVLIFEPRFVPFVRSGAKVHTIRGDRRRPIRPGDDLKLRYWEGTPYRSKQITIAEVPCLGVYTIELDVALISIPFYGRDGVYLRREQLEEFAKSDGFETFREMRNYWAEKGNPFPVLAKIITWGVHPLLEKYF